MAQWTSLEIAKLIASLLTPLVVVVIGYWLNRRLKRIELENQARTREYIEEKERARDELERRHKPHIQFRIGCNFFGPQGGSVIAEFVISAHNLSVVRHEFCKIILRVRGIPHEAPLSLLERHPHRLAFPDKLLETDIVPPDWNFIFVEPGVNQETTFVTKIQAKYRYILARAEFRYERHTPHTTERMFEVCPRVADTAARK